MNRDLMNTDKGAYLTQPSIPRTAIIIIIIIIIECYYWLKINISEFQLILLDRITYRCKPERSRFGQTSQIRSRFSDFGKLNRHRLSKS